MSTVQVLLGCRETSRLFKCSLPVIGLGVNAAILPGEADKQRLSPGWNLTPIQEKRPPARTPVGRTDIPIKTRFLQLTMSAV